MFKSYLKIGWRSLFRNKWFSLINIGGLAIGMMVGTLNALWIWDEFSFNTYFDNYDHIAQVAERGLDEERGGYWTGLTMTYPLALQLMNNYDQHFERITRVVTDFNPIVSIGDKRVSLPGIYMDASAPEIFSFHMMRGTRSGLKNLNTILLSSSAAKILFGDNDPTNQTLRLNNKTDVTITGVYEDFPRNTKWYGLQFVCPFDLFVSGNSWIAHESQNWRNHFLKIFVQLHEGQSLASTTAKVQEALQYAPEDMADAVRRQQHLYLYPMSDWHLYPTRIADSAVSPVGMVKLVGAIGGFTLLLACINFMNLSTARSEKRAKEVGVRKTIGSIRFQLIKQFFLESFLLVFFAYCLSVILVLLVLPAFNNVADKSITIPLQNPWFWFFGFVFVLMTSLLAGSYPALYLSSFNPIKALKGTFRAGRGAATPRKVLVVAQFSISVVLIICTIVIYQQIQFAKNRPVGYNRESLIMIDKKSDDFSGKYGVLRNELKNTGVVVEVSESMGPVTELVSQNNGWDWKGRKPDFDPNFATLSVSHLHGKTIGWQFISGRDFAVDNISDSSSVVINESAAKIMGFENPVGEQVTWAWWEDPGKKLNYTIIGIIKDMVMESPYESAEPTMFYLKGFNGGNNCINIKINSNVSASEALPKIEAAFKRVIPSAPFDYRFADAEYGRKFAAEERIGKLASIFSLLAVLISCLGLLGLASFVAEQRTKEIGIRKILGASVVGVWRMLSKDFVMLVIISCIVSGPIAYYLITKWLENFAYRTEISAWVFVATTFAVLAITLLAVSYQAIRAAVTNPVKSLRSE